MSALERHCRWLLHVYPAWYRRERAGEMLGTLLEANAPGRNWPSLRDTLGLIVGGLRVRRPLAPCLSMLWAALGALGAGYNYVLSLHVPEASYLGVQPWVGESGVIVTAAELGAVAWVLMTIPVLVAGLVRIYRGRLRAGPAAGLVAIAWAWIVGLGLMYLLAAGLGALAWVLLTIPVLVTGLVRIYRRRLSAAGVAAGLKAIAWAGTWMAGLALMYQIANWHPIAVPIYAGSCNEGQGCSLVEYRHAVISPEELAVLAGWLALGTAMPLILASTRCIGIREIRAISSS